MGNGTRYCRYEHDYVPIAEFSTIGGTLIHDADPKHRATDGVVVVIDGCKAKPELPPKVHPPTYVRA